MNLRADIRQIREGWSAAQMIYTRAKAIRVCAHHGSAERAEELAHEIEELQRAERIADAARRSELMRNTIDPVHPACPTGHEEWNLTPERWAEYLISGAYKLGRAFYPVFGATEKQALTEAHRVFFVSPSSGSKYIRLTDIYPLFPAKRREAA